MPTWLWHSGQKPPASSSTMSYSSEVWNYILGPQKNAATTRAMESTRVKIRAWACPPWLLFEEPEKRAREAPLRHGMYKEPLPKGSALSKPAVPGKKVRAPLLSVQRVLFCCVAWPHRLLRQNAEARLGPAPRKSECATHRQARPGA